MKYGIKATSTSKKSASMSIKQTEVKFGITPESIYYLANPAELFLGSFSSCILKNVERFSELMSYEYLHAEIVVNSIRLENPPRMDEISYELIIYCNEINLNIALLKKNIEKFGTIHNTLKTSCSINGEIKKVGDF